LEIYLSFGRKTVSANEIFTEDLYKNLVEIDYWNGDTKLVIDNKADIKRFYNNLSSLTLKEPGAMNGQKFGHLCINLVTNNEAITIGLLSGEIIINGKKYYTDKDICDSVRNIALKYVDYYNNDIFTQNLFKDIIEIDCWVENEKLVISDVERLEEVYHYLSRLTLEEASPEYEVSREPMQIDLVIEDNTISFGILSNVLIASDKVYYTDSTRDMVQLISSIAEENH
jgi:hypothetical protein